jgi:hypothetical protein
MNKIKVSVAEFFSKYTKPAMTVVIGVAIAIGSFKLGCKFGNQPKSTTNPVNALTRNEVSVAVNDLNQLIILDKATGKYTIFNEEVGMSVFGMYAGMIHQKAINGK